MQILPQDHSRSNNPQIKILIHPGQPAPSLPDGPLPTNDPRDLGQCWRTLNDLAPSIPFGGYSASRIAALGLKYSAMGKTFERLGLSNPRGVPIFAARAASGRVHGLLTLDEWLTRPHPSISNPARRLFTRQIEVFANILDAQIYALENNVCTLFLGGFSLSAISQHLIGAQPEIVHVSEERGRAA